MQGMWSTHRRAKINLNATSAPASSSSTPIATPSAEDSVLSTPPTEKANTEAPAEPEVAASETRPGTASVKRKTRSSRNGAEDASKRVKLSKESGSIAKDYSPPTTRLSDLGGVESCVEKMLELVAMPLCHPEVYIHTGVQPPRGVLLHGPPGCGKTLLAHAIAGVSCFNSRFVPSLNKLQELAVPFISVSAPSIVSGMSGESEKTLRDTFDEAKVRFSGFS